MTFCKRGIALLTLVLVLVFCTSCAGPLDLVKGSSSSNRALRLSEETMTPEEAAAYFTTLAIGSEYIDYDCVCRWEKEILYWMEGDYTDADLALMERLCGDLNEIDGFPGISPAEDVDEASIVISFLPKEEIMARFAYATERIEGITEYTADGGTCQMREARIAIDAALSDEFRRSSAICEEVVQALGLGQDSTLYEDSIFYEGPCGVDYPTELDFDMIRLLYSPYIQAGMTVEEVRTAAFEAVRGEEDES